MCDKLVYVRVCFSFCFSVIYLKEIFKMEWTETYNLLIKILFYIYSERGLESCS